MAITAAMVKALRDKTGLPMMECKKALNEANGDEEQAIEILRRSGLGQMSKRSERETSEGRVACHIDSANNCGGIVELRCETAPVASTDDFTKLADDIARHVAVADDPTPESIVEQPYLDDPSQKLGEVMHEIVNRLRENVQIAHVGKMSGHIGHYVHHNAKVGVLLELSHDCPAELRTDICMHIAAMNPACARRDEVDPELVEKERQFAAEQAQGKPENIIEKIVTGKLNRWYSEIVLLEQPFVKDDKQSVGQALMAAVPEATVTKFLRYHVGG